MHLAETFKSNKPRALEQGRCKLLICLQRAGSPAAPSAQLPQTHGCDYLHMAHVCSAPNSPFYSGAAHQTSASPLAGARPHHTYSLRESIGTAAIPMAQPQRGWPKAPQGAWLGETAPALLCCSCRAGEQDAAVLLRKSETENSIPQGSGHANLT